MVNMVVCVIRHHARNALVILTILIPSINLHPTLNEVFDSTLFCKNNIFVQMYSVNAGKTSQYSLFSIYTCINIITIIVHAL